MVLLSSQGSVAQLSENAQLANRNSAAPGRCDGEKVLIEGAIADLEQQKGPFSSLLASSRLFRP